MKGKFTPPPGKKISKAQKIAVGGIFSSLSLILLLFGTILPFSTFVAPVFAGIFLIPILIEIGTKYALLSYITVSILSLFISSDTEMVLLFIFLLGYYPILFPYLQRIKSIFLRLLCQFAIFNTSLALIYGGLYLLFGPAFFNLQSLIPGWTIALFIIAGNVIFFMYTILLIRIRLVYCCYFRKKIFH